MILEKYIWKFADWCLNTPLLEMASERSDRISRIKSKSQTINEHIFKWCTMPESIDRNHWLGEMDNHFFEIQDLTWGRKRRFGKEDYFDFLYREFYTKDYVSIDYKRLERTFSKIEAAYPFEYRVKWAVDNLAESSGLFLKGICALLEQGDYDRPEMEELIYKYLKI